jgi:hypothetical protein
MRRAGLLLAISLFTFACSSGDSVKVHHPLGGFPDEPSTVIAVVSSIDTGNGLMRVNVKSVDSVNRSFGDTVWIDEKTIFTNSGGGPNLRSWEDLRGAEIQVKGWYREDRYYADSIDVLGFPLDPGKEILAAPTPRGQTDPSRAPTPRPTP